MNTHDDSPQAPDTAPGPYYVSALRDVRTALVSGPYPDHAAALAHVEKARAVAEKHDPRAVFDAFGTVRIKEEYDKPGMLQLWGYDLQLNKITGE